MRTIHRAGLLALTALGAAIAIPNAAEAQASRPAVVDALLRDIAGAEQKLMALAEAIPEASYGWRPGEGVRSIGEVVMHVAADNYFLPTFAGTAAPEATGLKTGDYASVQAFEARKAGKAEAIEAMRDSFAHLRASMEKADAAFLARTVDVFGTEMTGLNLWVITTTHLHEHLGQMIAYARSNSIVPPWSR